MTIYSISLKAYYYYDSWNSYITRGKESRKKCWPFHGTNHSIACRSLANFCCIWLKCLATSINSLVAKNNSGLFRPRWNDLWLCSLDNGLCHLTTYTQTNMPRQLSTVYKPSRLPLMSTDVNKLKASSVFLYMVALFCSHLQLTAASELRLLPHKAQQRWTGKEWLAQSNWRKEECTLVSSTWKRVP